MKEYLNKFIRLKTNHNTYLFANNALNKYTITQVQQFTSPLSIFKIEIIKGDRILIKSLIYIILLIL